MQRVDGGSPRGGVSQPTVGGEGRGAGDLPRSDASNASGFQTSPSQWATGLLPVDRNPLQPSPKETLDKWVNEKSDEIDIRRQIANQIVIDNGNLKVRGNLYLRDCTGLTSLPENLSVGGNLSLRGCTGLTSLPEGLSVGGNLYLCGCTGITSLQEWVFQLQPNQTIHATNTGISLQLLQEYNSRQNSPGYRGPRIEFSILDNQSSIDVTANNLPQLVQTITGTEANHPFWQYAAKQTKVGSSYNSFAQFLTRLLNELPAGDQRQKDLKGLLQNSLNFPVFLKFS